MKKIKMCTWKRTEYYFLLGDLTQEISGDYDSKHLSKSHFFTVSWIDGKVSYREAILLINKNIQNTPHCGIDRHRQRKLKRRKVRGGNREIERKSYKKGKRMFRLKNCVWMCVGVCNPIRILIIALEDNNIHQSLSY